MNSSSYRVRRATLDDLPQLTALWVSMHFPPEELGKRVTEFQVAENAESVVLGAVGLQIAQRQGKIHSEAFTDLSVADDVRPIFWERIQSVATNHGLLRLWSQEQAPFWNHGGLAKADDEALEKLPALWKTPSSGWLTLKLKEDLDALVSADKEFAVFMESEKQRTLRTIQHAKILKVVAALVAFGVIAMVLAAAFFLIRKNPN